MQKVNRPLCKWRGVIFGCISLLVIIADQLSKQWIRDSLSPGQTLLDAGFYRIIRIHNTGAAFGLFRDNNTTLATVAIIGIVAIVALIFILSRRWPVLSRLHIWVAVGLIIGGTIGNQIDRLRLGYVTDFIDFKVWPAFNVADSSVVVGVIIIAYSLIFLSQPAGRQQ